MNDVLVSIVNHHHVDLLPACLDSVLRSAQDVKLHAVVLDNASSDGSADMVRCRYPAVELIAQTSPDGFSANINTIIGPRVDEARYFLLLNDDACLDDGALKTMVAFMDNCGGGQMALRVSNNGNSISGFFTFYSKGPKLSSHEM